MACRWKIAIVLALPLFLFCATFPLAARTLEEKFQIARPQTHHIVLLDTSGSIKLYSPQLAEAVQIVLKGLLNDYVITVYCFDDSPVRLDSGVIKNWNLSEYFYPGINHNPKSKAEPSENFEKRCLLKIKTCSFVAK